MSGRPDPAAAPVDPRTDLPGFGDLPVVAPLRPGLVRVIAPNPSPMTLDGTNTYVVSAPGSGVAAVVDPGPPDRDHLARVEQVVADLDAEVAVVLATHHHLDHSEALRDWGVRFGCDVAAPTDEVAGPGGIVVEDDREVGPDGARLQVVATPGHCADHVGYRLADGSLLVGDHVLGRGTSVVAFPDGDLLAYLDSLARVRALGPDALWPGHGPALDRDPTAVLEYYAAHRSFREGQVVDVLASRGPATAREVVEVIYAAYDRRVWEAAEASTRAALAKLAAEGIVDLRGEIARLVPGGDTEWSQGGSLRGEGRHDGDGGHRGGRH